jgi:hypothetical protein
MPDAFNMKMNSFSILILLLFGMWSTNFTADPYDYATAWKEVEKFRKDQLPESALKKVVEIYQAALAEKNGLQLTRATFYRAELTLQTQEEGVEEVILQYETALAESKTPWRNILQSQLAGFYLSYFESNRYTINQRTELNPNEQSDVRTMSGQAFIHRIQDLNRLSLENKSALQLPTKDFAELLRPEWNEAGLMRRPTLYLVLAQQYLNYLSNGEMRPTLPSHNFTLVEEAAFADRKTFIAHQFTSADTTNFAYRSLLLFQELLPLTDEGSEADIEYDLARLQFVRNQYAGANANGLYRDGLEKLLARAEKVSVASEVTAELAGLLAASSEFKDKSRAAALCQEAMTKHPNSPGANRCQSILFGLEQQELQLTGRQVYTDEEAPDFHLSYRNAKKATLSIYRIPAKMLSDPDLHRNEPLPTLVEAGTLVKTRGLTLTDSAYIQLNHPFEEERLPLGAYLILVGQGDMQPAWFTFQVSNLALVVGREGKQQGFVVDRFSGKPIHNANVTLFAAYYDPQSRRMAHRKEGTYKTDKQGIFTFNHKENVIAEITHGKDYLWSDQGIYPGYTYTPDSRRQIELYTDRAIYRPGQEVFFKGLFLEYDRKGIPAIEKNSKTVVILRDANYQKIAEVPVLSNAFGSFTGKFKLPVGQLTGIFTLETPHGNRQIRVEEYKRPTFELTFNRMDRPVVLGDTMTVKGMARGLAGYSVDGAEVRFEVYRQLSYPRWCWFPPYPTEKEMIDAGNLLTDDSGGFKISFPTKAVPTGDIRGIRYVYTVEVTVTDPSGETRTATHQVSLLNTDYQIRIEAPQTADVSDPYTITIKAELADGTTTAAKGMLEIVAMQPPKLRILSGSNQGRWIPPHASAFEGWTEGEVVRSLTLDFNAEFKLGNLSPGVYKLKASSTDSGGQTILDEDYILITDRKKGRYPKAKAVYVHLNQSTYAPGETLIAEVGVSDPDGRVYYILSRQQEILQEGWLHVKGGSKIQFALTEAQRGGMSLQIFHVKNNEATIQHYPINVPWTNKELDIVFETFRDKITPGAKETYNIRITPRKGEGQAAEVLMAMYDASLDQFTGHEWSRQFYPTNYGYQRYNAYGFATLTGQAYTNEKNDYLKIDPVIIPELLSFQFTGHSRLYKNIGIHEEVMLMEAQPRMLEGKAADEESVRGSRADATEFYADGQRVEGESGGSDATDTRQADAPIPPRAILNETVFFLPQIHTNPDGSMTVSFTMNEALTRWRLMSLAHTADFKVGYDERFVTTSKDLMILPNAPRFIKSGDAIWFSARIANTTDQDLPYTAALRLQNDLEETDLAGWISDTEATEGTIPAGKTIGVRWLITVPLDSPVDILRYTTSVRSGQQADAEQNVLPILSSLIPVTETKTIFIRGNQNREIQFDALQKSTDPRRVNKFYTVEYTANPVWYAVQALPYLSNNGGESTVNLINRYFANKLGLDILQKQPLIERVFRQWEKEGGEALLSNLSKNEELKTLLLEETPWVRQALSETEQKAEIASFFNTNQLNQELSALTRQITERQSSNGGLVWMPGSRDSEYITNYFLGELGQLESLGIKHELPTNLINRAIQYLDERVVERYNEIQKLKTKPEDYQPDPFIVSVLFTRSHFPQNALKGNVEQAYTFFKTQAIKYRTSLDIHSQALLGRVLFREGHKVWEDIRASLLERSFYKEDKGRYFNLGNGYQWHELTIERHAAVLDFFVETDTDVQVIDEMKIWLLNHKRVNRWHTTKATSAAIYTLLQKGSGKETELSLKKESQIFVAGEDQQIAAASQTATGYFKRQWSGPAVRPDLGKVRIDNQSNHVAWGGLYYQYLSPGSAVEAHGSGPLDIQKEFYKVVSDRNGERLERITSAAGLKAGDELVSRIIITSDRDMQFIGIKDMRGAGIEPGQVLSGMKWEGSLSYYLSIRDVADHYFIQYLRKGTHVLENRQRVVHRGRYDAGIATVQSSYAPEFSAHSQGFMIEVK